MISEGLKEYYKTHEHYKLTPKHKKTLSKGLRRYVKIYGHPMKDKHFSPEIVKRQVIGRLKYYKIHGANKRE
jgi:hypothetical protein